MTERAPTEPGLPSICKYNDLLVEAFGVSGRNGRMGAVEKTVKELGVDMKKIRAEQTKMHIKLALLTSGSSLIGGGAVAALMRLLG